MKRLGLFLLMAVAPALLCAQFVWRRGERLTVTVARGEASVVHMALELLQRDGRATLGAELQWADHGRLTVVTRPSAFAEGEREAFRWLVDAEGRLTIEGSDPRGTAYGLVELTRRLGVSAWEWWADVVPEPVDSLLIPQGEQRWHSPSVAYRGLFINDEDWGLQPWSGMGPDIYNRIFELMLRLKANTLWPAMHECTRPFFLTEGNRQLAAAYGICIGGSHCEPMACNAAGEWGIRGQGDYDYVHNDSAVRRFWEDRVREVAGQDVVYTLGMRGVHDGAMQGARTLDEQRATLERVFHDQRELLRRYVRPDVEHVPQVFIPYKEVLDIYHSGLRVPDDVCLMWCDDNYGYIRHFPDSLECRRTGGNGLYYHVSYWGRPHDYLWLGTASPALMYNQLREAYNRDIRRIWVLNVGDIKPCEYQLQLFFDMAWDVELPSWQQHLSDFLAGNIGPEARRLVPELTEHYRLAMQCKPEFLAGTRVEERDPAWKVPRDLPWSMEDIRARLAEYGRLSDAVEAFSPRPERAAAYFHLVQYPVQAAAQMNRKHLTAQLARHGLAQWEESDRAHDSIVALTARYNWGKWQGFMDCAPRRLPVFQRVPHVTSTKPTTESSPVPMIKSLDLIKKIKCSEIQGTMACEHLGVSGAASELTHEAVVPYHAQGDSLDVELRFLPTHPISGSTLRLRVNGSVVDYATHGRSEEWKQNVLRNQAIRRLRIRNDGRLHLQPLDPGIIIDEIRLYKPNTEKTMK